MKTSNKLIIVALLVFITSIIWYNFALLQEFKKERSAKAKDPYHNYDKRSESGFNKIEINGATLGRVSIMQGPYKVMTHKSDFYRYATITQVSDKLIIDVSFPDSINIRGYGHYEIIIFCPKINELKTTCIYKANGKTFIANNLVYDHNKTIVKGFIQDSLSINLDNGSYVMLDSNQITSVRALVGASNYSYSTLEIGMENQIKAADFNLRNNSELKLNNVLIPNLNYNFSDNSKASLSGVSLGLLKSVSLNDQKLLN